MGTVNYDSSRIVSLMAQRDAIQRELSREYAAREAFYAAARVDSDSRAIDGARARIKKLQKIGVDRYSAKKIEWNALYTVSLTGLNLSALRQMESQLRALLYGG
jgi:hypothetical protein